MPLKVTGTLYTLEEAKRVFGVTRETLWKAIKRGDLPAIRYAYRVFVKEEDLIKWKAEKYRADMVRRKKKEPSETKKET